MRGRERRGHERAQAVPVRRDASHVHVAEASQDRQRRIGANDVGVTGAEIVRAARRTGRAARRMRVVGRDHDQTPAAHGAADAGRELAGAAAVAVADHDGGERPRAGRFHQHAVQVDDGAVDGTPERPRRADVRLGIAGGGELRPGAGAGAGAGVGVGAVGEVGRSQPATMARTVPSTAAVTRRPIRPLDHGAVSAVGWRARRRRRPRLCRRHGSR